jgi:hypothetical protein
VAEIDEKGKTQIEIRKQPDESSPMATQNGIRVLMTSKLFGLETLWIGPKTY